MLHPRDQPPVLCGILNVTPDSFSDGGRFLDSDQAVAHGRRMIDEGAMIVDVGGESTRPGAEPVPPDEQRRRVLPAIRGLAATRRVDDPPWRISIDTTSAEVAEAALAEGATIVNDVSAGLEDPRLLDLAGQAGAGVVLMHRRVRPALDSYSDRYATPPAYGDVVAEVGAFLARRLDAAEAAGVPRERIAIDPGFGFGKSVEQNFELLARLAELKAIHPVIFVGLSRKSFLAARSGSFGSGAPGRAAPDQAVAGSQTLPGAHGTPGAAGTPAVPAERLAASLAGAVLAALAGVSFVRVHDVAATRDALAVVRRLRDHLDIGGSRVAHTGL